MRAILPIEAAKGPGGGEKKGGETQVGQCKYLGETNCEDAERVPRDQNPVEVEISPPLQLVDRMLPDVHRPLGIGGKGSSDWGRSRADGRARPRSSGIRPGGN
jgi:hypothetical protein